jgi:hypothetical protein
LIPVAAIAPQVNDAARVIFAVALRGSFRVSRGRSGSRFGVNVFTFFPVQVALFF